MLLWKNTSTLDGFIDDIDQTKIDTLMKGESYINHISKNPIKKYSRHYRQIEEG